MFQRCRLHKINAGKKGAEEQNLSVKDTKRSGKKNVFMRRGYGLTVSDNCVVFSLSKHDNPLSLCVDFGQRLGFLDGFLNVLGLQPTRTE